MPTPTATIKPITRFTIPKPSLLALPFAVRFATAKLLLPALVLFAGMQNNLVSAQPGKSVFGSSKSASVTFNHMATMTGCGVLIA